jgi:hypothetical protein
MIYLKELKLINKMSPPLYWSQRVIEDIWGLDIPPVGKDAYGRIKWEISYGPFKLYLLSDRSIEDVYSFHLKITANAQDQSAGYRTPENGTSEEEYYRFQKWLVSQICIFEYNLPGLADNEQLVSKIEELYIEGNKTPDFSSLLPMLGEGPHFISLG